VGTRGGAHCAVRRRRDANPSRIKGITLFDAGGFDSNGNTITYGYVNAGIHAYTRAQSARFNAIGDRRHRDSTSADQRADIHKHCRPGNHGYHRRPTTATITADYCRYSNAAPANKHADEYTHVNANLNTDRAHRHRYT
jgi:hypothetical protein